MSIQNRPPRVTSLQIRPETVLATDSILADVETQDPEGDDVTPRYQWLRNGVEIRGATGPILDPGQVRRGDTVQAAVSPVDERGNVGQEVRSAPKRVQNSPPTILSNPPFTLAAANRYEYQIRAEDPDGDHPLRYDLVDGPRGMRVDVGVGRLTWTIPTAATGDHDVEVSVRDLFGGETRQRYSLSVGLEAPPAALR